MELSARLAAALAGAGAGLLLDLDGTLVLSEETHQAAYHAYFTARGWAVGDDVVREFSGRRGREVFAALDGPWRGEDPVTLTAAVIAELERLVAAGARPGPVPGAVETLAAGRRLGLPMAVVTSAAHPWADVVLEALGPAAAGIALVTAEDCTRGKPDPEPYTRGARALGRPVRDLVAAEDTPAGVASARAAGVGLVVGVTTTRSSGALLAAGADACLPDLRPLADAVTRVRRARQP